MTCALSILTIVTFSRPMKGIRAFYFFLKKAASIITLLLSCFTHSPSTILERVIFGYHNPHDSVKRRKEMERTEHVSFSELLHFTLGYFLLPMSQGVAVLEQNFNIIRRFVHDANDKRKLSKRRMKDGRKHHWKWQINCFSAIPRIHWVFWSPSFPVPTAVIVISRGLPVDINIQ